MRKILLAVGLALLVRCPKTPPPKSNPPREPADPPPHICTDPDIKKCPAE